MKTFGKNEQGTCLAEEEILFKILVRLTVPSLQKTRWIRLARSVLECVRELEIVKLHILYSLKGTLSNRVAEEEI